MRVILEVSFTDFINKMDGDGRFTCVAGIKLSLHITLYMSKRNETIFHILNGNNRDMPAWRVPQHEVIPREPAVHKFFIVKLIK